IIEKLPEWIVGKLFSKIGRESSPSSPSYTVGPYSPQCGDRGIDLGQERLLISNAFGSYFAGLLERKQSYVNLKGQIECQPIKGVEKWEPIQRIFWALQQPRGPRLLIIAADGGMGKSTLAAKVIRCLFEEQAIDMILGDSAKVQRIDHATGKIIPIKPGFYDVDSFYANLCRQLGLPKIVDNRQSFIAIKDRLFGRRAVIVVDNLETVQKSDELLQSLQDLTTRDIRVVVTTRSVKGLEGLTADILVVHLLPIREVEVAHTFLEWHIQQYQDENPRLQTLINDLGDRKRILWLIECTGGVPLLIQLVFSDVARFSWEYLEKLPRLFGNNLLSFLYQARWNEINSLGVEGQMAREILLWIAKEQYRSRRVTFQRLNQWAETQRKTDLLTNSLSLLYERFLIVNHDPKHGDFALLPSLLEFIDQNAQS
ncbi:MAG: ATP-binding protein, partial [Anaerolineales bacterium]|nr:ATP-binding protein [Anaerolineales bacterium]